MSAGDRSFTAEQARSSGLHSVGRLAEEDPG
jgi:hypothetical protein